MGTTIQSLRDSLKVPKFGRIDFKTVLGSSLAAQVNRWKYDPIAQRRAVVHKIDFDDITVPQGGDCAAVIDTHYKASHGVDFQACKHTYDWATHVAGFEPAQGHYFGVDTPLWVEPHVYAVGDHGIGASCLALSAPNAINVNGESGAVSGQLLRSDDAIRINFDPPAAAVQVCCSFKVEDDDQGKPIANWPLMLAYDGDGKLLDEAVRPYPHKATLTVSSWAGDIAYVMLTVGNRYSGVEPCAIFDDLLWTTLEFVLLSLKKQRDTPPPVLRSALVDRVVHHIGDVQVAQRRLHRHLGQVADAALAAQLLADSVQAMDETEALLGLYRKITRDTANRSSAEPLQAPVIVLTKAPVAKPLKRPLPAL